MNLIDTLRRMAADAEAGRWASRAPNKDAEDREAIETVRAMQEALDSIRKDCRRGAHELGMSCYGVEDIARRCAEALRRAEGNAG